MSSPHKNKHCVLFLAEKEKQKKLLVPVPLYTYFLCSMPCFHFLLLSQCLCNAKGLCHSVQFVHSTENKSDKKLFSLDTAWKVLWCFNG